MPYTRFPPCERGRIHALYEEGKSMRAIVAALGRHCTPIARERARNGHEGLYEAEQAKLRYRARASRQVDCTCVFSHAHGS